MKTSPDNTEEISKSSFSVANNNNQYNPVNNNSNSPKSDQHQKDDKAEVQKNITPGNESQRAPAQNTNPMDKQPGKTPEMDKQDKQRSGEQAPGKAEQVKDSNSNCSTDDKTK